jgi:ribulose 1,5-bisphosphate carboxylase large subunit-like protein
MARKRPLPANWRIAGLHVAGSTFKVEPGQQVTDKDIRRSDAIIVEFTSPRTGTTIHRTVHGAKSKTSLGTIIETQVRKVSPRGKYRRDA